MTYVSRIFVIFIQNKRKLKSPTREYQRNNKSLLFAQAKQENVYVNEANTLWGCEKHDYRTCFPHFTDDVLRFIVEDIRNIFLFLCRARIRQTVAMEEEVILKKITTFAANMKCTGNTGGDWENGWKAGDSSDYGPLYGNYISVFVFMVICRIPESLVRNTVSFCFLDFSGVAEEIIFQYSRMSTLASLTQIRAFLGCSANWGTNWSRRKIKCMRKNQCPRGPWGAMEMFSSRAGTGMPSTRRITYSMFSVECGIECVKCLSNMASPVRKPFLIGWFVIIVFNSYQPAVLAWSTIRYLSKTGTTQEITILRLLHKYKLRQRYI